MEKEPSLRYLFSFNHVQGAAFDNQTTTRKTY